MGPPKTLKNEYKELLMPRYELMGLVHDFRDDAKGCELIVF